MNVTSGISSLMLIASVISYFALLPASVTVHVGDDTNRVDEIKQYGFIQSKFSVIHEDRSIHPSSFRIGPDAYHLMIWHNDKIVSMTYFRYEGRPNTYGKWLDVQEMDSFTVHRPSPSPFFYGMAILGVAGFLLKGSRQAAVAWYSVLILFVALMLIRSWTLVEGFAIQPMLVAVGWLTAPIVGRSMTHRRQSDAVSG